MEGFEVIFPPESAEAICDLLGGGLFFAPREEIDRSFALPSAYRAYRPYM